MSEPLSPEQELDRLLDRLCDEQQMTRQEGDRLAELLRAEPENRERYLARMELHSTLWLLGDESEMGDLQRQTEAANERHASRPGFYATMVKLIATKSVRRPKLISVTVAATVMLLLITAMAFMAPPFYRAFVGNQQNTAPDAHRIVARLTGLHDADWQQGQLVTHRGAFLQVGHQMELKRGFAEVTFDSGAKVLLEGPASFEIIGVDTGKLSRGKLTAHVTSAIGNGLTIETPQADIIDHGTRFGVSAAEQQVDVVVFEGAVDVAVRREGVASKNRQRLGVGQTLRVQSGRTVAVSAEQKQSMRSNFTRDLDQVGPVIVMVQTNSHRTYRVAADPLGEDVVSHTDRPYQWNGVTKEGLPSYLVGAQYVQTAMDDKLNHQLEVRITVRRPATMYVLVSTRGRTPDWVPRDFQSTGDVVGLDTNVENPQLGIGPGVDVDQAYSVWRREVTTGEVVALGPPQSGRDGEIGTYGIAVVATLPGEE